MKNIYTERMNFFGFDVKNHFELNINIKIFTMSVSLSFTKKNPNTSIVCNKNKIKMS